jgi:hypothetical protein
MLDGVIKMRERGIADLLPREVLIHPGLLVR